MDIYNTEEQQIKALKDWWSENGTSIIVGIVIGVSGFFGYNWWQDSVRLKQEGASNAYAAFIEINAKENADQFIEAANKVKQEHKDTGYALLASLHLAKQFVLKDDFAGAEKELRWATEQTAGSDLQAIMKVRLARVLNAQEKYQDAAGLLQGITGEAYKGLIQQVLGDTYLLMGEAEKARTAYLIAKESTDSYIAKNELEMLVNDLATSDIPVSTESSDKQDS